MRRGVVLGLLVLCVLSFTAFFREGEGGFLHSFKGTVGAIVSPVQEVAVAAVQPIRDGWNWFAELRGVRDERNRLLAENEALRNQLVENQGSTATANELRKLLAIKREGPDGYTAIAATVTVRPPVDIEKWARIDKGRNEGVTRNSLVFVPATGVDPATGKATVFPALVGHVQRAYATSSDVTFITDPNTLIAATVLGSDVPIGLLKATPSGGLLLTQVPGKVPIVNGDIVVTLGTGTDKLPSLYPKGLRVGAVSSSGQEPGGTQTVQVEPFRDPIELDTLMVFAPDSPEAKRRAGVG